MKILLSTIGSRGELQPLLALALALRSLGHEPRLCVPPNFAEWVVSFGLACMTTGPDVKKLTGGAAPAISFAKLTPEERKALAVESVRSQFAEVHAAARDCDLVVGAGELQVAARSIAEVLGVPYVFVAYCPLTFPSPAHAPAAQTGEYPSASSEAENVTAWANTEKSRDQMFLETLNAQRIAIGLAPTENALRHLLTDRPWLAADPTLGPLAKPIGDMAIVQTGAWQLAEEAALPESVERFLSAGEPPLYLGFGSMSAPEGTDRLLVSATRAVGRRAILSRGWAELAAADGGADCISIGDVSHAALFPRVAAVVHHGGAGTTTTAAIAGRPQVIVPRMYDQFYWAKQVERLGIGVAGPPAKHLALDGLVSALREGLTADKRSRAQSISGDVRRDGAENAAKRLVETFAR